MLFGNGSMHTRLSQKHTSLNYDFDPQTTLEIEMFSFIFVFQAPIKVHLI